MKPSYKEIIQSILRKHPNLNIHGYSKFETIRSQAMQAEMWEEHHEKIFMIALSSLQSLFPHLKRAEYVKSLVEYLERKHPGLKFYQGLVIAACLHLNCVLRNDRVDTKENQAIHHDHVGWSVLSPLQVANENNENV